MRFHGLFLAAGCIVGATVAAQAQTAPAAADPLSDLQKDFGTVVGDAFHRPDPIIATASAPGGPAAAAGGIMQTGLEVPGAAFAALMQPLAAADPTDAPAAAPAPAPRRHRHAFLHRRRVPQQG